MIAARPGLLRIYLGAAPGVGKTCALLEEGRQRLERGEQVVIGAVDTRNRPGTVAVLEAFRASQCVAGIDPPTDVEWVSIDPHSTADRWVVLVDDLTGRSGSEASPAHWTNVVRLLDAGFDVVATLDVTAIEPLAAEVHRFTGEHLDGGVPESILERADDIEFLDKSPQAMRRRFVEGHILTADGTDTAAGQRFGEEQLAGLRAIALTWLARRTRRASITEPEHHERVAVALSGAPGGDRLVRRAAALAASTSSDLIGVSVTPRDQRASKALTSARDLLEALGGTFVEVRAGSDVADDLISFTRSEGITQLVIGTSPRSLVRKSVISRVIAEAHGLDVHVVGGVKTAPRRARMAQPTLRRRLIGASLGVLIIPAVTASMVALDDHVSLSTSLLVYVLVVTGLTSIGGATVGFSAAIAAFFGANYYLTAPTRTLVVTDPENVTALIVFFLVAAIVSTLVHTERRRSLEAGLATAEAEAVAASSVVLAHSSKPIEALLEHLHASLDARPLVLEVNGPGGWAPRAGIGELLRPEVDIIAVDDRHRVRIGGAPLESQLRRFATAVGSQLATAIEAEELRRDTEVARERQAGDAYRTALLRAVSHDLRTPLTSIKTSVTSLLAGDVVWSAAETAEFLSVIDEGSDRLDYLIGNLLDMSRLQTGAIKARCGEVSPAEIAGIAIAGLSTSEIHRCHIVEECEELTALADAALLERVLANLLTNALRLAPEESAVVVRIGSVGDERIQIWIVDRGPGIPDSQRQRALQPFERLDNVVSGTGFGLGLAIADGFVTAMEGRLRLEETPGGGLTAIVDLPRADGRRRREPLDEVVGAYGGSGRHGR